MKLKALLLSGWFVTALLLSSCSKDEGTPSNKFVFGEHTVSLTGAKLYLTYSSTFNNRELRQYFISDGDFTNNNGNNGWDIGDYDGATYFIGIELCSVVDGTLQPGDFPQDILDWGAVADDKPISDFHLELENGDDFSTTVTDLSPIKVSGGFNNGQTLTFKFSGDLTYYIFSSGLEDIVTGEFYFSGKVQDKRLL
jgi:hypothetical protein